VQEPVNDSFSCNKFDFLLASKSPVKSILRNITFYSFALFLVSQVLTGVKVSGGFWTYILGGVVLTLLFLIVKPMKP
jgi:hypothetical protein